MRKKFIEKRKRFRPIRPSKLKEQHEKGWVKKALLQGELKITESRECPIHNPEHKPNVPTMLNACEKDKWASREWLENLPWYKAVQKQKEVQE